MQLFRSTLAVAIFQQSSTNTHLVSQSLTTILVKRNHTNINTDRSRDRSIGSKTDRKMCQSDSSSVPPGLYRESLANSESSSNASSDFGDALPGQQHLSSASKRLHADGSQAASLYQKQQRPLSIAEHIMWNAGGVVIAIVMVLFSLWFPFFLSFEAATNTYDKAFYVYNEAQSIFDNSVWTYGTDYALTIVMSTLAWSTWRVSKPDVSDKLCNSASILLASYAASVLAGGISHHFYTSVALRNHWSFRLLWTICVGTVTGASTFMGLSGSEVVRRFQLHDDCHPVIRAMPIVPASFWYLFGLTVTAVLVYGGMSFQRPACDIFIAGITQVPSSLYFTIFFLFSPQKHMQPWSQMVGSIAFILNAPLLPMYPLLVQYTDMSLGAINTLLHSWLCVAWTLQGLVMRHSAKALVLRDVDNKNSVAKKTL